MTVRIKKNKFMMGAGIAILVFLGVSYFIKISSTSQEGQIIMETRTSLLGMIILYNPFVLGLYILIALALIAKGLGGHIAKRL